MLRAIREYEATVEPISGSWKPGKSYLGTMTRKGTKPTDLHIANHVHIDMPAGLGKPTFRAYVDEMEGLDRDNAVWEFGDGGDQRAKVAITGIFVSDVKAVYSGK